MKIVHNLDASGFLTYDKAYWTTAQKLLFKMKHVHVP